MNQWIPRTPAQPEIVQSNPVFEPVKPLIASELKEILKIESADIYKLKRNTATVNKDRYIGYYLFRCRNTQKDLFIKIIPADQSKHHSIAEELTSWLYHKQVSCQTSKKIINHNGISCYVYDFREFRIARCDDKDGHAIGQSLAILHREISGWPKAYMIQKNGKERLKMLDSRLAHILHRSDAYPVSSSMIKNIMKGMDYYFEPAPDANLVHGDLNLSNIGVDKHSDEIIFLDFEDSLVTWLPPETDIAMILQRLVLESPVSKDVKISCGISFLKAYHNNKGRACISNTEQIIKILKWITLRGIVMLCELHSRGFMIESKEWNKFFYLADRVNFYKQELDYICNGLRE